MSRQKKSFCYHRAGALYNKNKMMFSSHSKFEKSTHIQQKTEQITFFHPWLHDAPHVPFPSPPIFWYYFFCSPLHLSTQYVLLKITFLFPSWSFSLNFPHISFFFDVDVFRASWVVRLLSIRLFFLFCIFFLFLKRKECVMCTRK